MLLHSSVRSSSPAHVQPRTLATAAFAALLVGCGGAETEADPDAGAASAESAAPAADAPVVTVSAGLATPESVLWDAARGVWYVSNINGNPPEKDGNGYIIRLDADGAAMDDAPFIDGAADGVTLHGPKGLALSGDTLWVADIDALRGFDVTTGAPVAEIDFAPLGATFLNDVAVGDDGAVYISDSGIGFDAEGNLLHPGQSQLFVVRDGAPGVAVTLPAESAANGIAWDAANGRWLIVGYNTADIYAWTPGAAEVEVIGSGPGGGDGLLVLADGRVLFSSWASSALEFFADGATTTFRGGLAAPADLGYDPERGLVAVPLFNDDRVEVWSVASGGE
jgi:sugar lactone lactonase YvrE